MKGRVHAAAFQLAGPWLFVVPLVAGSLASLAPPDIRPAGAPADDFSAERAFAHVLAVADEPRPMGSARIARARSYIASQLEAMGLHVELQERAVPDYFGVRADEDQVSMVNVLGLLRGVDSTRAVALMAHYDSAPATPGASDNAAGVAAILETVRALRAGPPLRNDLLVIFTDGEEPAPRYGASAFLAASDRTQEIGLIVNLEAIGSAGPSTLIQTSPGNRRLIREFSRIAPRPVAFSYTNEILKLVPGDPSDFGPFTARGIPGLHFAYTRGSSVYHTALDNAERLDRRSLQHHGSNVLAVTRHFGALDLARPWAGVRDDAVYFTLAPGLLVHYPEAWAFPLAVLSGLVLAGVFYLGRRRGRFTTRRVAGDAVRFLSVLVSTTVLVSLVWWAISHVGQYRAVARGGTGVHLLGAALLVLTVAIASVMSRCVGLRAGNVTRAGGGLCWWWLAAMLSSAFMPGFSYLFTWPLLAGLLAAAWNLRMAPLEASAGRRIASLALTGVPGIALFSSVVLDFYNFAQPRPGNLDSEMTTVIALPAFLVTMLVGLLRPIMAPTGVPPENRIPSSEGRSDAKPAGWDGG